MSFLAYIEHVLAPTLRPGDAVVLDNLSVHRSPAVRAAVEIVGATRCFLPKYSPDLNPIELYPMRGDIVEEVLRAMRFSWTYARHKIRHGIRHTAARV